MLAALLLAFGTAVDPPPSQAADDAAAVAELVQKLKSAGDKADTKLVKDLAGRRTRAALDGLLEFDSVVNTTFMRREIARALVLFDGVPEAEQPALQRLMDMATQSPEPELRRAALDGLGECHAHGKDFLAMIVTSSAADPVRETAMEHHLTLGNKDDAPWYRGICARPPEVKAKKKEPKGAKKEKEAEEEAPKKPPPTGRIRGLAFQALAKDLEADEVVEFTSDPHFEIRRDALLELERRGDKRALDLARAAFLKITPLDTTRMKLKLYERVEVRIAAAQIFARQSGTKAVAELTERASSVDTPMELRRVIAEILSGMDDPEVNRQLKVDLGKGQTHEKLFHLWAVRRMQDEKLNKAIEKLLNDKNDSVVIAACRVLGERRATEARPQLEKLTKGKDPDVIRAALEALSILRSGEAAWFEELLGFSRSEDPELRNLALQALGKAANVTYLPKLKEALHDKVWSTRLAALEALESLRVKEAITAIIERMGQEEGRMLMEFANTLWRLTGQPYQDRAKDWENWWKQAQGAFHFLSEQELAKVRTEEAEWRLKQVTRVEQSFFGIRVISHRVIFVVDVSGSMHEELHGDYEGKTGHTRWDVLRRELQKCIGGLDASAFFNLITFSSGVGRWTEGSLAGASEKNRKEAQAYLNQLAPLGGTNLYGGLSAAFNDADVDTIFVISDGEPTDGAVTDQLLIRDHVKTWNEYRRIVINTIAVGGQYQILEWLAEDSGGTHVRFE